MATAAGSAPRLFIFTAQHAFERTEGVPPLDPEDVPDFVSIEDGKAIDHYSRPNRVGIWLAERWAAQLHERKARLHGRKAKEGETWLRRQLATARGRLNVGWFLRKSFRLGPLIHSGWTFVQDPFIKCAFFWWSASAGAIWLAHRFHVAFAYDDMLRLFALKVPFLGLIIAARTFQYRVWRELADRDFNRILDPQWLVFERRVTELKNRVAAALAGNADVALDAADTMQLPIQERSVKDWKASNAEVAHTMLRGILPHSMALLGNFIFVGTCLLLSSAADVVVFLTHRDISWLREVSSALFGVILLPFAESVTCYFISAFWEFRVYRSWFAEQREKAIRESK